ncbi:MAG: hypothetical protein HEP71_09065 [Roseivirga sp.]|nr:hypothetical protein [Roseivirga sp.]
MKKLNKLLVTAFVGIFLFGISPVVNLSGEGNLISSVDLNSAYAFQSSFGLRVDYRIVTDYYVDIDTGNELCSYLRTETISGSYCDHGWDLCGRSGSPSVSSVWTGESICVSY